MHDALPRMVGYRLLAPTQTGLCTTNPPTVGRAVDEVLDYHPGAKVDLGNWCPMSLLPVELRKPTSYELEFCPVFYGDNLVAVLTRNFTDDQEGR